MASLVTALSIGAVYALVAIGYNVIYLTTRIFNFAHGAIIAVCALVAYTVTVEWGLNPLFAVALCVLVGLLISSAQEVLTVRPLERGSGGGHLWLVSTLGVAVVLEGVAQLTWGVDPRRVDLGGMTTLVSLGDGNVSIASIVAIVSALVLTVALDAWYKASRTGKVMRAMAEDRQAAEVRGIDTRLIGTVSFAFAGAIAGAAALVIAPITFAHPGLGAYLLINAFVAMAIGGFGSHRGALIGGFVVGLVTHYGEYFLGVVYAEPLVFLVLLVLLVVYPRGLFGPRQERVV